MVHGRMFTVCRCFQIFLFGDLLIIDMDMFLSHCEIGKACQDEICKKLSADFMHVRMQQFMASVGVVMEDYQEIRIDAFRYRKSNFNRDFQILRIRNVGQGH